MSATHIPRAMSSRGKTSMEMDREGFQKSQTASIQKAINHNECAVKEKHARIVIIGTHKEHGSAMYWNIVRHMPLQENPIVAWKFCHVTHKLLRDGHPNVLSESQRAVAYMTDLGKLWGHLKEGYGLLIAYYARLLIQKLSFHKKNPQIAGNLILADEQLDKICNHDINLYFELSVDMLDYMDDVLSLQNSVFGSLDSSRANSMTPSGQCRLAPLVLCVTDSCQLYDYLVKILFRLHSCLPADTLTGHRDRFYKQYRGLKQFYFNTQNLQYFKNLIRVPTLPDSPPDFLRASDLNSHVKPVAVVPEVEQVEVEETPSEADQHETSTDLLVDMSDFASTSSVHEDLQDNRDAIIKQLMWEVNQLRTELLRMKAEDQMIIESLHNRNKDLEMELNELRQIAESTNDENELLKDALKDGEKRTEISAQVNALDKIARTNEDRFKKMKEIYTKLREEHVQVLKEHTENVKKLNSEKKLKNESEEKNRTLAQVVSELTQEKVNVERELLSKANDSTAELTAAVDAKDKLVQEKQELEKRIKVLDTDHSTLKESFKKQTSQLKQIESDLQEGTQKAQNDQRLHDQQRTELEKLKEELEFARSDKTSSTDLFTRQKQEFETLQKTFEKTEADRTGFERELTEKTKELEKLTQENEEARVKNDSLETSLDLKNKEAEKLGEELRAVTDEKIRITAENLEELKAMGSQLKEINDIMITKETELKESQQVIIQLRSELDSLLNDKMNAEKAFNRQLLENKQELLECAVNEGQAIIKEALAQAENPHHSTVRCTAEYLLNRVEPTLDSLKSLRQTSAAYAQDKSKITDAIKNVCDFSHFLSDAIVFGFATSQSAAIEPGEELSVLCKSSGEESLKLLSFLKEERHDDVERTSDTVDSILCKMMKQAQELIPKIADVDAENMGDLVDQEMLQTTKAIETAASRISDMLAKSREQQSGIQLEVNEKILDSCNSLMKTIQVLIEKSKVLQREIVSNGRGTSSIKEFYKKHHRWTEGLISAAKAVGWGANVLVEAADKVVRGDGKFEELVVCSQEIAASTAQLVVSSKVKAQRNSENLQHLSAASKLVSQATGQVVASAKSGAQRIEDLDTLEFSKLTLHQAKRLEMESQVHLLELESNLEKERRKLSELRKTHYKLAGESEGWEQEDTASHNAENKDM